MKKIYIFEEQTGDLLVFRLFSRPFSTEPQQLRNKKALSILFESLFLHSLKTSGRYLGTGEKGSEKNKIKDPEFTSENTRTRPVVQKGRSLIWSLALP
jgi:hypothetical protein